MTIVIGGGYLVHQKVATGMQGASKKRHNYYNRKHPVCVREQHTGRTYFEAAPRKSKSKRRRSASHENDTHSQFESSEQEPISLASIEGGDPQVGRMDEEQEPHSEDFKTFLAEDSPAYRSFWAADSPAFQYLSTVKITPELTLLMLLFAVAWLCSKRALPTDFLDALL
jgi:hypothetical protein